AALTLPAGFKFFPLADLPYEDIPAREIRALLRRYSRERHDERFSIYMDSGDGGRLASIDGGSKPWMQSPKDAEQEQP
ncbi:flavin reductase, partial [Mesorhizobium sp. M7A.F.Ca.US.014.04.1.1]